MLPHLCVAGAHYMEYLPMGGLKDFVQESMKLAYGEDAQVWSCLRMLWT